MCTMTCYSRIALLSSVLALISSAEAFQTRSRPNQHPSMAPAHLLTNSADGRTKARWDRIIAGKSKCLREGGASYFVNNRRVSLQLAAKSRSASTSDGKTQRKRRSGTSPTAAAKTGITAQTQTQKQETKPKSPSFSPKKRRGRPSSRTDTSWYQRSELLNHRVLNREEELELGRRIAVATELRDRLTDLAEHRRAERELYRDQRRRRGDMTDGIGVGNYNEADDAADDVQFLPSDEELFQLGMANSFSSVQGAEDDDNSLLLSEEGGFTIMDQTMGEASEIATTEYENDSYNNEVPIAIQEGSKFSPGRVERDLSELSNVEVCELLGVQGGKDEVRATLRSGAEARRELMKCNIRLVVSISKKWMRGSPAQAAAGGKVNLREIYEGGWDRPSLDEVIQEGILGLSRAIDKFDYTKGLKFSTYSTWWITNMIRLSFQTAKTGPLKLPSQFHLLKNRYLKKQAKFNREGRPLPPLEDIADEFGTSVRRLRYALSATESLFSIDQPVQGRSTTFRGSGAGELGIGSNDVCLGDALVCNEPRPEEFVELSFLRQSLETALATELSPHERDVVRLRLGLDDGQTHTAKEVAKICGDLIGPDMVRRAERRAFKKLSSPSSLYQHHLQDYLYLIGGALDDEFSLKVFR